MRSSSSGNVLFIILIAVALFAALSYAVSQSSRGGGNGISKEDARLCLAEIDSQFANMRTGIQRIKALGYDDYGIDTYSTQYRSKAGGVYGSPNTTCTENGCRLFSDNGGSVAPAVLSPNCTDKEDTYWDGSLAAGHYDFVGYRIPQIGNQTENSLYARVHRIKDEVCIAYNVREGFPSVAALPTDGWFGPRTESGATDYKGTLSAFPADDGVDFATIWGVGGSPAIPTNGRSSFCFTSDAATGTRVIISLMLQR